MTRFGWAGLVGVLGASWGSSGCGRVDVYAITSEPVTGATAGHGSTGGASTGGAPTGGTSSEGGSAGEQSGAPSACPSPVWLVGDTPQTVRVGSVDRSYVLHVPPAYSGREPVPLIVDFHGIGSTGGDQLSSSPYPAITDPEGVVMAFPDGTAGPLGPGWNLGPCCVANVDDLAFARALVSDIQRIACIDPERVYAVGVLTGGGMAYHLACRAADVFAAVAPAAFDLLEQTVEDCQPSRPITVISFRGTEDARVPYEGGDSSVVPGMPVTFLGARGTFERWAQIDGCTGLASEEDSNGCSSYSACSGGVEVILCTKYGGREEPGDASIAWPVLRRHSL